MTHSSSMRTALISAPPLRWLLLAFWAIAMVVAGAANATVSMRVDARQSPDPINAYVTVTDTGTGAAVPGLTTGNFTVLIDGGVVSSQASLPPEQDSTKKVSVVFAMDFSGSTSGVRPQMRNSVIAFINAMKEGDHAAIVKFNNLQGAHVIQSFTPIDAGVGGPGRTALINAVNASYDGTGTNLYDGVVESVGEFTDTPTLPGGPKAIILISDGDENLSNADANTAIGLANDAGISIFTVGVGNFSGSPGEARLVELAAQASGKFYPAPNDTQVSESYVQIRTLLTNEYLVSVSSNITNCSTHTIEVQVPPHGTATQSFARCTPIFAPDLRGLSRSLAEAQLIPLGLVLGTVTLQYSAAIPNGSIISQDPTDGVEVAAGSAINVVISDTSSMRTVPNVVGQLQTAATTAITGVQLVLGNVTQQSSTTVAAGIVISQNPVATTVTTAGAAVNLVVSSGPPVPNVVGLTQTAATTAITGAGLVLGTVTQQTSASVASGNVISQTPTAGSQVAAGSAVSLVVSSGPPPATTPPTTNSGGGGGGATGLFEIVAGLGLLGLARRRRKTAKVSPVNDEGSIY